MNSTQPLTTQPGRLTRDNAAGIFQQAVPALLFGLRLWASVCLALYVAFWLELDTPSWAGTTAAIVVSHISAPRCARAGIG